MSAELATGVSRGRAGGIAGAVAGLFLAAGLSAQAQTIPVAELASRLGDGVRCTTPAAEADIDANIATAEAPQADIRAALEAIAADQAACAPLRDAAAILLASFGPVAAPEVAPDATAIAVEVLTESLADAQRRVASLKFNVTPPPPNLTKGRAPRL